MAKFTKKKLQTNDCGINYIHTEKDGEVATITMHDGEIDAVTVYTARKDVTYHMFKNVGELTFSIIINISGKLVVSMTHETMSGWINCPVEDYQAFVGGK